MAGEMMASVFVWIKNYSVKIGAVYVLYVLCPFVRTAGEPGWTSV